MVFGLDHLVAEQEAVNGEIGGHPPSGWIGQAQPDPFTASRCRVSPATCGQHRWSTSITVTSWCRAGGGLASTTSSLMHGLEVPVLNQFGLRPAGACQEPGSDPPLVPSTRFDERLLRLLNGVSTFNFHTSIAALCADNRRCELHSCLQQQADRPVPAASIQCRGESASLIRLSGCRRTVHAAAISCSPTPQSSLHCSDAGEPGALLAEHGEATFLKRVDR